MKSGMKVGQNLVIIIALTGGAQVSFAKETVGQYLQRLSQPDRGGREAKLTKSHESLPQAGSIGQTKSQNNIDLSKVKPPKSSDMMRGDRSDQANLERVTDEQIRELFKLTQRFKSSPTRGELWLRLAELYSEKAQIVDFRKQTEYDHKLKEYQDGRSKQKPRLDTREATEYNKKAIQLYEWFVRDFPRDPKMDQALFFLGFNYFELGENKKGHKHYSELTQKFPRSSFLNEANFALAEYHFENEEWKKALDFYIKVLKNKNHRLFNFALYKSAWCLYRLGDIQRALSFMEKLIQTGRDQATNKNVNRFRLEQEALRDIVVFYGEGGGAQKATEYFKNLVGKDYRTYLDKLAYYWSDKGNRDAAYFVFRDLIEDQPNSPKAFDYQYQIVVNAAHVSKSRQFRDELFKWVREYGPQSSWGQANRNNSELLANAAKLREVTLKNHVLQMHQTAQNSRADFSQQVAQEGYQVYIESFPNSPQIADMHFFFGELLYDMGKYDEAATQYKWVVDNAPDSKYASKSTLNVVLSLEKNLPSDKEMQTRLGKSLEKVSLDPRADRFIRAGNWYLGKYPNSDKAVEIKFRIGRLYYLSNHLDEASQIFREIVQKHPNTKSAEYSANLMLDIFNLRKDYAGLEKAGQELLALPQIADSRAGQDIKGVLEKASFKKGQDLEVNKDYAGGAAQYEAFAKQNPNSPLAVTASFNAGVNYERAGQIFPAIMAHKAVLASTRKEATELKPKSRRLLAKLYQDTGQYDLAAQSFAQAGSEAGKDPLAPNFFYNAAALYAGLGRSDLAVKNYSEYFNRNQKSDRIEALFEIAEIHRQQNQNTQAIQNYTEYIKGNSPNKARVIEAHFHVYELNKRMNRTREMNDWASRTLSVQSRLNSGHKGLGAKYVSQIRFDRALEGFREFVSIKIPSDPAKQKAAADKKLSLLGRLNSDLTEVIKYDNPEEIVGALTLIGQANANMAQSLLEAPLPSGLNPEETKQYRAGIEKLVEPYKKTSKESFKRAVERGQDLEAYSPYYDKAYAALRVLEPGSLSEGGEIVSEAKNVNWIGM